MRNTWYPRQKAEYVTAATLEGVKPQTLVAERDFTFGVKPKEDEEPAKAIAKEKSVEVQTKLLPVSPILGHYIKSKGLTPPAAPESFRDHRSICT